MFTPNIAAVFWPNSGGCCVKNARKVSNLAALFALHLPFLPQKPATQVECKQILRGGQSG
ncbi:hypothetical protein H9Q10_00155 [Eikenella sp. S3360]|uniref:Uncharacterized protein n=1 Tax=Eikenella glucosivorans TaxID=2766967 RepID=A0ABS0N746_9NEIS|nr:hypothetical protein [Eikenella glucosivorans]